MSETPDWPSAFLATSVILGEPREAAEGALGDAASLLSARLAAGLGSTSREARARALASVVAGVAMELERSRLA